MTDTPPDTTDNGAYLSFGGWAKEMPNPPALHDRRRYTVDVECTATGTRATAKGDRDTRSLSIIRVTEVTGAVVPPPDEDPNQEELFPVGEDAGQTEGDGNVVPMHKD